MKKKFFSTKKQAEFLHRPVTKRIKDVFVPTHQNEYKPKVLRSSSLGAIVVALVMVKIFITLFLFFIYPDTASFSTDIFNRIVELTNQSREQEGIPPLKINNYLNQAAQAKAEDMILRQYFEHNTPEGKKPWQWIDKTKYDYVNAGENLAIHFSSADSVHSAFLKSPSHAKNILNKKYEEIGVSVLVGELEGKNTMVMVEMFGSQRGGIPKVKNELEVEKHKVISETIKPLKIDNKKNNSEVKEELKVDNNTLSKDKYGVVKNFIVLSPVDLLEKHDNSDKINLVAINKGEEDIVANNDSGSLRVLSSTFQSSAFDKVYNFTNYLFFIGFIFLILILILNIIIKIEVQHPVVIVQSLMAIMAVGFLFFSKIHFAQQLLDKVIIG